MISTNNVRTKTIATQGLSLLMTGGEGLTKLFWTIIISWADQKYKQTNKHTNPQKGFPLPLPPPPYPASQSKIHPRRYEKKRESFDLYTAKLKAERCDFGGKIRPGAGTLSKQGFLPCLSIIKNSPRRTQIHSKSLIKPLLRQNDDYTPQGAVSRKPRKRFGPVKPLQNLEPFDYRAVLFTYSKDEGRFTSYKKFQAYTLLRS